ncbi:glycerophosphodiester phosphodiesterase [soil metagenome]
MLKRKSLLLLLPLLLLLIAGGAYAYDPIPDDAMNPKPLIIAHRGASGSAPENTLSSFKKAIDVGVDFVELDIHLSKDGELIVIHDATLDRTTTGKGPVQDKTLAELQQLDAGSWYGEAFKNEPLPTLRQVLELVNGQTKVLIEIKSPKDGLYKGIEQKTLDLIKELNAYSWCEMQSFHPEVVENWMAIDTQVTVYQLIVGALVGISYDDQVRWGNGIGNNKRVAGINPSSRFAKAKYIKKLHEAGYLCFVWTINEPEEMTKLMKKGVDGIITNYPERLKKLIEEGGK